MQVLTLLVSILCLVKLCDSKKKIIPLPTQCTLNNGGCDQICNPSGSPVCSCYSGYRMQYGRCVRGTSTDPCENQNGGCAHICWNRAGTPVCSCRSGYRKIGKGCTRVPTNPCQNLNGGCAHICRSQFGRVVCSCRSGYRTSGKQCIRKPTKTGTCPRLGGGGFGFCWDRCYRHEDCRSNLLCCTDGCGRKCVAPAPKKVTKPGICPTIQTYNPYCDVRCGHDGECYGKQKCCPHGQCSRTCMTPGSGGGGGGCPPAHTISGGNCWGGCQWSGRCLFGGQCCRASNGCKTCVGALTIVISAVGTPPPSAPPNAPSNPCKPRNGDCAHICKNVNGKAVCSCKSGYTMSGKSCKKVKKSGKCPSTLGMYGACGTYCTSDGACSNSQLCCSNGCGRSCMDPVATVSASGGGGCANPHTMCMSNLDPTCMMKKLQCLLGGLGGWK